MIHDEEADEGDDKAIRAMIRGLALLLVFQSLGEVIVKVSRSVVPGPVIGMVLLFTFLVLRKQTPESLGKAADGLLAHLAIFYIPAAVGVMLYARELAEQGLAWALAIVLSTVGAMIVPALLLKHWLGNRADDDKGGDESGDNPGAKRRKDKPEDKPADESAEGVS